MRTAAMVLGLVAGVLGLLMAVPLTVFWARYFGGGGIAGVYIVVAFAISVIAIAGGVVAVADPSASTILMVLAGVVGFLPFRYFWIPSGIMLFAAAGLQLKARDRVKK
jgi:hypothetical protein